MYTMAAYLLGDWQMMVVAAIRGSWPIHQSPLPAMQRTHPHDFTAREVKLSMFVNLSIWLFSVQSKKIMKFHQPTFHIPLPQKLEAPLDAHTLFQL